MLVRNEKFEMIDSAEFAKLIDVSNLKKDEYSEEDAENALVELLKQSAFYFEPQDQNKKSQKRVDFIEFKKINVKKLWREVKKQFCKFATKNTIIAELIKIIIEAIASVVILGTLIKKLVEIIVKHLIDKGVATICPV